MTPSEMKMGTIPEDALLSLLRELRETGRAWRTIVSDARYPALQRKVNWFSNAHKALMYRITPVPKRDAFLDIGAGSGVVASVAAAEYSRVYALEYKDGFVQFMKLRFAQDGIENAHVIRGNALAMPLRDGSIDLAAVNGGLEWLPNFCEPAVDPRDAQLGFLREVRRCLSPGGKVVVAIENRWDYWHLRGHSPHGEAPFACVLPRAIADALNRAVRHRPYREYIYGCWGYSKLFREAGLRNARIYLVHPSYYSPHDIYAMRRRPLEEYHRKHHASSRLARLAYAISQALGCRYLLAFFGPAYYIEAQK